MNAQKSMASDLHQGELLSIRAYNQPVTLPGEHDLSNLLRSMRPSLHADEFVFCTLANGTAHIGITLQASVREAEGLTIVVKRQEAELYGLAYIFPSRMITLNVHSALDAVGFLAAVTRALNERGISSNVIAGYYHDHLFVAVDRADEAMDALRSLSSGDAA